MTEKKKKKDVKEDKKFRMCEVKMATSNRSNCQRCNIIKQKGTLLSRNMKNERK